MCGLRPMVMSVLRARCFTKRHYLDHLRPWTKRRGLEHHSSVGQRPEALEQPFTVTGLSWQSKVLFVVAYLEHPIACVPCGLTL